MKFTRNVPEVISTLLLVLHRRPDDGLRPRPSAGCWPRCRPTPRGQQRRSRSQHQRQTARRSTSSATPCRGGPIIAIVAQRSSSPSCSDERPPASGCARWASTREPLNAPACRSRRRRLGARSFSGGIAGLAGGHEAHRRRGGRPLHCRLLVEHRLERAARRAARSARPVVVIPMAFVFAGLRTGSGFLGGHGSRGGSPTSSRPCSCWRCSSRRPSCSSDGGGPRPPGRRCDRDARFRRRDLGHFSRQRPTRRRSGSPTLLAFAAAGEWVAERAGTLNISVEGMFLGGAFAAALGSDITAPSVVGLLFGSRRAHRGVRPGQLSHRLTANQFVVGLDHQRARLGLTAFLDAEIDPSCERRGRLRIPGFADIPLVGDAFFGHVDAVPPLPAGPAGVVARVPHPLGPRSALGRRGSAGADVSGIDVNRRRRQAVSIGGLSSGLAGAYLSSARSGSPPTRRPRVHRDRRGDLRRLDTAGALAGAVVFGFFQALGFGLPSARLSGQSVLCSRHFRT